MGIEVIEVLSSRNYAAGYVIRRGLWRNFDEEPLEIKVAYTPDGDYIGDSKWAYRLCKVRGIKPEKLKSEHSICSVGFCDREQKWYGWSHRAIYGFGIGSETKRGDCAYHATDKEDYLLDTIRFWTEDDHLEVTGALVYEDGMYGVRVNTY